MIHFNKLVEITNAIYNCDVLDKSRCLPNVFGRSAIFIYLRHHGMSLMDIAAKFEMNHATVLRAINMHEDNMLYSEVYRNNYNEFTHSVTSSSVLLENFKLKIDKEIKKLQNNNFQKHQIEDVLKCFINQ